MCCGPAGQGGTSAAGAPASTGRAPARPRPHHRRSRGGTGARRHGGARGLDEARGGHQDAGARVAENRGDLARRVPPRAAPPPRRSQDPEEHGAPPRVVGCQQGAVVTGPHAERPQPRRRREGHATQVRVRDPFQRRLLLDSAAIRPSRWAATDSNWLGTFCTQRRGGFGAILHEGPAVTRTGVPQWIHPRRAHGGHERADQADHHQDAAADPKTAATAAGRCRPTASGRRAAPTKTAAG